MSDESKPTPPAPPYATYFDDDGNPRYVPFTLPPGGLLEVFANARVVEPTAPPVGSSEPEAESSEGATGPYGKDGGR